MLVAPPTPIASKTEALKLARAERLGLSTSIPRLNIDAPPQTIEPTWVSEPSDREVERAYPSGALADGAPGSVVLGCRERLDGSVDRCEVLQESPAGAGFGRAALKLSRSFRFTPFIADGRPAEVGVRIPYDFDIRD